MPWPYSALRYQTLVSNAVQGTPFQPELIAAIIDRESLWQRDIVGDNGHGHGLGQVDDRTWGSWLAENNWRDPAVMIPKVVAFLLEGYQELGDIPCAVAAYNCGPGRVRRLMNVLGAPDISALDMLTTERNYVSDVFDRMAKFEEPLELEG